MPKLPAFIARQKPQAQLGLLAAVLMVGLVWGALILFQTRVAVGAGSIVFAFVVTCAFFGLRDYPHMTLGWCNAVTLSRGALIAFVAGAALAPNLSPWFIFCLALVTFAMDGLDGWLARRERLSSDFGARFDMETDALFGAVLSLIILQSGVFGPEILILGFMRYAFVGASIFLPQLSRDLPESMRRKSVCVVQITALLFLIFPLAPTGLVMQVAIIAIALLVWSFAVDTAWLLRAAR